MIAPPQEPGTSLIAIESGLTAVGVALAPCWPRIGAGSFARVERVFARLARRRHLAVTTVGGGALLLRLAILPLCPIPLPFAPGDFSFLLASDTFASGRLTNPTPAMWVHFESIHITMLPTYMSMYFPAQGLVLAASNVLTGQPWLGVLVTSALMCAAICWMLQAWLPATWALLGGCIAVLHLGLFSYWVNTYHAGGSIAALGGALVLGSLPQFLRTVRLRYSLLMAAGVAILGLCRPYECLLLCLPVAAVLMHWLVRGKNRPPASALLRCAALPLVLVVAAGAWLGYYDYRVYGNPLTLPYTVDRNTYAMAPYFVWQAQRPEPAYRHEELRRFYDHDELLDYHKLRGTSGYVGQTLVKGVRALLFFAGIALLPPLIMLRRVLMDRRVRFLVLCVAVLMAGMAIEVFLLPHYMAAFTSAIYALGLQAMRHLRQWRPSGQQVGLTLVRVSVAPCVFSDAAGLRLLFAGPLHFELAESPASEWNFKWYGPGHFGVERAQVEAELEQLPGPQLAIVRYSAEHNPSDEWVYNAADIDSSKVIWARGMDDAEDTELIRYYKDRRVWLVEPDQPAIVSPYPPPKSAASR